jgi:predicted regulator of Ras-like GTPase activity (Roadblock/LC7/MglB family)
MDEQTLAGLRRVAGVTAAYIVDGQGVVGASARGEQPAEQVQVAGALLAAVVSALRQAAADLAIGGLADAIVEGENGAIVAGALSDGRAAVVVADGKANLGMIRVELRRIRRTA